MGMVKKRIKIVLLFLLILSFIPIAYSMLTVRIDVKDSFKLNEEISFDYKIISDKDVIVNYMPIVNCPNEKIPLLSQNTINLIANVPYKDTYKYLTVKEDTEPQICAASVQILNPLEIIREKKFKIDTNPSFKFDIELDKKIFVKNQDININYNSEVSNPLITATLIFPDKSTKQITLPYSFKAKQLGTYNLEVTASKESYKTISVKEQFGVIEKEASIPYVSEISPGKLKPSIEKEKRFPYWILLLLLLIILFVVFIYFYKNRNIYK